MWLEQWIKKCQQQVKQPEEDSCWAANSTNSSGDTCPSPSRSAEPFSRASFLNVSYCLHHVRLRLCLSVAVSVSASVLSLSLPPSLPLFLPPSLTHLRTCTQVLTNRGTNDLHNVYLDAQRRHPPPAHSPPPRASRAQASASSHAICVVDLYVRWAPQECIWLDVYGFSVYVYGFSTSQLDRYPPWENRISDREKKETCVLPLPSTKFTIWQGCLSRGTVLFFPWCTSCSLSRRPQASSEKEKKKKWR